MTKTMAVVCLCLASLGLASGSRMPRQIPGAIKVEVHLVEVYATVYDHKGTFVDGLARDSFQILDDGKSEQITNFETAGTAFRAASSSTPPVAWRRPCRG